MEQVQVRCGCGARCAVEKRVRSLPLGTQLTDGLAQRLGGRGLGEGWTGGWAGGWSGGMGELRHGLFGAAFAGYEDADAFDDLGGGCGAFGQEDVGGEGAVEGGDGSGDDHGG